MADDTRQPEGQSPPVPKPPANTMFGGTAHTAGGRKTDEPVSRFSMEYVNFVRNLPPDYYKTIYMRPCYRDSLLQGIASGAAAGCLAVVFRRPVMRACEFAVLAAAGVSCVSYQLCQRTRSKEKEVVRRAQELLAEKRAKHEARKAAFERDQARQARELEARKLEEARKHTWGYWYEKNIKFW